ncbi:MAG: hypothetical protein J0M26_05915 [Planctomycetes bacterium]|nr:hypothetical protein [Planctomycetota bacterium]
MSVIGDLLSKIRGKRTEKFASKAAEYDSFVVALSRGDEVDVDTLAELLDELDKSDSDLEKDIASKQRRHETAAEIVRLKNVERELRKAEGELQRLRDEVARFVAERQPRIDALAEQTKYMQLDFDRLSTLQDDLLRVGVPLYLQQKRQEITARRRIWAERERAYTERIDRPRTLAHQESMRIEVIDGKLSRCDPSERELLLDAKAKAEQVRQGHQSVIDSLAGDKRELDAERAAIEAAERALNAELLKP